MHRTTVLLPPQLHTQVIRYAQKYRRSLGEVVRSALKNMLNEEEAAVDSPFFTDTHFARAGNNNTLAQDHDEELYS